ncbi:hypothetical protein [Serratia marcescens]|uniref:hypothetical protein n=1 Tax=Serratia marcescens TaxID=615 RepID=UPI0005350999|nr:hypothetical protein [Serratia marcescens]
MSKKRGHGFYFKSDVRDKIFEGSGVEPQFGKRKMFVLYTLGRYRGKQADQEQRIIERSPHCFLGVFLLYRCIFLIDLPGRLFRRLKRVGRGSSSLSRLRAVISAAVTADSLSVVTAVVPIGASLSSTTALPGWASIASTASLFRILRH